MNKLLASSLSKTYYSAGHKLEVLKNVNITLAQGKTIGVIGSSGSGKTTLLQMVLRNLIQCEANYLASHINFTICLTI